MYLVVHSITVIDLEYLQAHNGSELLVIGLSFRCQYDDSWTNTDISPFLAVPQHVQHQHPPPSSES